MRSDADPVAGHHENGSLREQADGNGRGSYGGDFGLATPTGVAEAAYGEMEHAQTNNAGDGDSSGQYLDEDVSPAAPQWFEAGVAQGGVGLGLALWPPTPSLPADPADSTLPPPPSRSPTPSSSSSRSTSPVVGEDYATAPVDLVIPALERMPSVSVADGPMGRLAASTSQSQTRSFFSNLLNRGSRASWSLSGSNSPSSSSGSSPELPGGSFGDTATPHGRSVSMPQLASSPGPRLSSDLPRPASRQTSRSPRSLAARTFATISRSASMRSVHRSDEVAPPPFDSIPSTAPRPSGSVPPAAQPRQSKAAETAPPTLSSIGLTLNAITPNLSLSRNAQPLCGAILDGRYLLIGTTSGLDFLPLPEKGSLPVQHRGLKKRRETRKPLSLIKRTRFKQMVVLNERSNVLVAIAGRNDHVRVYALDGIRAMIERRLAEVDPLQGYPIPPPPPQKGKQRDEDVTTSNDDPLSSYQFPPSPNAPERVDASSVNTRPPNPPDRHPCSQAPVRISHRAASSLAPTVRSLPTAGASAGPSTTSSQHRVLNQPRDFIASRRSSTASIPRRPSRPDLGTTSPSLSRRASLQSVNSRRSSTHTLGSRRGSVAPLSTMPSSRLSQSRRDSNLEPRAPLRQLNAAEGSPTSSLAEFLRETGPEMGLPDLDKLIVKPRRHSVDVDGENRSPRAPHFPLGRGVGEMPRLRRFSAAEANPATEERRPSPTTEQERNVSRPSGPRSPSLELAEILYGSGPPRRQSQLLARSPLINDQEVVATSRALLETLTEEPPSAALLPTTPRARKRWTFNGPTPFQLSRSPPATECQLSPTAPASPPLPRANEPELPAPVAARTEVVNVVPTYARPTERRDSQQQRQRDLKRRSIASMRILGGPTDKSPWERSAQAHPANVQSPLEYVKLARSRGARVLKAVETRKRTYLAILSGEDGDRIELFTGSKNISLSLNRTFVLPDTPRSIELQLQGDELVDIYLMYAESIFALEPSTVRVREVGVGREERRARRQRERQREEQERQFEHGASTPPPDPNETVAGSSAVVDRHLFDTDSPGVATSAARASPPLYASPSAITASQPRSSVSAGAEHARPTCDYSAFQQLPCIPPVPASVLASAWTIPPLYTDVVSDDASLSPVSLLGGAALRNNGPPGLFFCSKGMELSGIMTADGKSVIKSPLRWSHVHHRASYEDEDDADGLARHRLEILVLSDRTTVVVKLTDRHVEALPIVGRDESPSPIELPTRARSSVHFLATNMSGEQLFFAEANNSSFTIKCLSGLP
ncbi:hypothetical protein JCM10908_000699 [Rhodotorula pacifica]|uniref:uncharacterized protein n=1 Tax=Rhodotorula pacifica TaxID=1495444 RepID=UPI0031717EF9